MTDWNAVWIAHPAADGQQEGLFHFRKELHLASVPPGFLVHVTGDNRYRLYVNGVAVSRGPAASDPAHWRYQTVDLAPLLRAGRNIITATVWNWGAARPVARMSHRTGFLLQGAGQAEAVLDTGPGWQVLWNRAVSFELVDMAALGAF